MAHAAAAVPVCSQPADALAAARFAVQVAVAELVRSAEAARIHSAAEDGSSPAVADLILDDSLAERWAAPSKDALPARAALPDDSCPDGCKPAARYSAPDGSAAQRAVAHCAPAALRDGCPAGYLETADSAEDDSSDWAGSLPADSAAVDSVPVGSLPADSVAVGSAVVCCSADSAPADYSVEQMADDRCVPAARMDD
ncbi:MAG TPA: hypothetical protein VH640_23165 [Bryobacteraceae bacterium]